ncbi:hypothetical protein DXB96_08185 [Clostridium sp. OM07-10AC]|nr:hypothetical protein DXB96_08185 [Clostridium sp. OM07-10AC]
MKKIKRRGLSWLLVMAMVLSGLALPNGQKAKAAETSYDLTVKKGQSPLTMAKNPYGTDYISDILFDVPDVISTKDKVQACSSRIEVTLKINSVSSDTGSIHAMLYTQDDDYDKSWNQSEAQSVTAGKEMTLSYELSDMNWKGTILKNIAIRFADNAVNTSTISYKISSAKVIVDDSSSTGGSAGGTTEDGLDANAREDSSLYSASYTAKPGNQYWTEYTFSITNHTSQAVSKVQAVMKTSGEPKGFKSFESINAVYNATVGGVIVYYAGEIAAGATVNINGKIGFDPTSVTVGSAYVRAVNCNPPSGESTESGKLNYKLTGTTKDIPDAQTPVGKHGKLHLKKVAGYGNAPVIVDKNDNPYQLRGASSHGIQWDVGYNYVNKGAMQSLRDEWGVNLFRMACYVTQDGYTVGAQSRMDQKIEEGVQAAKELGMYVIVDWHIHAENPHTTKSWAKDFFKKYATKYKDYDNVIFEICNEPTGVQWYTGGGNDLYSYCKEIAGIIRDCGSDALIVCGTNTWSQDVEDVAKKPLKDDGFEDILYTFHFYSGSHYADKMAKVKTATADGTPIFVTEFGICDASGNGGFDTANADAWIKLCDSYNISYACWSFCNKGESASYLSTSCSKTIGGYVASDLATTGIWLVNTYRAHQDIEEGIDTKVTPKPSTSASAKPGTSSSEKPSTSASAKPGTSSSEKPSTSASAKPGTSSSEKPSTSASAKPGTDPGSNPEVSSNPATDKTPVPGESQKPGESAGPTPGSSEAPVPGESAGPVPGSSGTPVPDTSSKPGTSPTPTKSQNGSTTSGGGKTTTAPSGSMAQSPSTEDEDLTEDGEKITLRLAKKTLTIKCGKKKRIVIKVKASGDKVKRYKVIGRKKIVRVNAKGVVAAKKTGKVTIKVIMKSGATAKCKIIVKK